MNKRFEKYPLRNIVNGISTRNDNSVPKPYVKIDNPFESPLGKQEFDLSNVKYLFISS